MLQVLDEQGLAIRGIAGTSMGAVMGAMYLQLGSAEAVIERWREAFSRQLIPPVRPLRSSGQDRAREHPLLQAARRVRDHVVIAFAINRTTLLEDVDLRRAFDFLVRDTSVEELPLPFVAVAVDLATGEEVRLDRGELRPILRATSAIPGVLPAVVLNGRRLVDGGVLAEVPVAAARSLGWPVVAVDVAIDLPPVAADELVLDTMMRTQMITSRVLRQRQLDAASDVIRPAVGHTTWSEWTRFEELVEAGRSAAVSHFGPG